jgi:uncharacterized RDD family membrane protein YckC
MDPLEYPNPYAPPSAGIDLEPAPASDQGPALASRGARLGASLIDQTINGLPIVIATIVALVVMVGKGASKGMFGDVENPTPPDVVFQEMIPLFLAIGVGALGTLGVGIFQCYRIATTGQSLAKKWLNLRVVLLDGSPVNFGSGVGMRAILPWFIAVIPYIGSIFALVDALMIFRDDRRCLHDLMAGTKVVAVPRQ